MYQTKKKKKKQSKLDQNATLESFLFHFILFSPKGQIPTLVQLQTVGMLQKMCSDKTARLKVS